jgi:hypothetical protein
MFLKLSAQASTVIGDHGLWRVVVWGLGHSGRSRWWWAPGGGGVAVPAIEIEFAGRRSYRNPGSGVARFAGSLWF